MILLTGGTGSFGRAFVEQRKDVRILSNDEYSIWQMQKDFNNLEYSLGDVRDYDRMLEVMDGCDSVVHAAALKHVPFCEDNPTEAIKTNVLGSYNVIKAAKHYKLEKVVAISTDKAVNPMNVYGSTKHTMEEFFLTAGYTVVRFGNFIGSRGSVFPLWEEQAKSGEITITDPDMKRYWISLEDAVKFTIEHLDKKGLFYPDMKQKTVGEMAKELYPDVKWDIIGTRKNEKMEEEIC